MGYIFFTICVGLVCFYIGRVEFLAEKLHAAEKITRMAQVHQIGQGNNPQSIMVPGYRNHFQGPGFHGPGQRLPGQHPQQQPQQPQPPLQPQQQQWAQPADPNLNVIPQQVVQHAPPVQEIFHRPVEGQFSETVQAAAKVMESVQNYAAKEIIETANIVQNAVEKVGEIFEGVNLDENILAPEDPIADPKDIPSRDVAALIATVNSIDLNLIYSQQVKEVRKLTQTNDIENIKASIFYQYDQSRWNWQNINFKRQIPNTRFVFHNKLPKSGSSTMNQLLKTLSRRNKFNFAKVEPAQIPNDRFDLEKPLVKFVQETKEEPFFLLKHHFIFNFTKHGLRQPTMVNVVRDPTDWFVSQYYFRRYGWERDKNNRNSFIGSEEDRERTVDDCIKMNLAECIKPSYKYIQYICGNHPHCRTVDVSEELKAKANELAKTQVLRQFFMIGILEQFVDTLEIFQKMLPAYYDGVIDIWNSDFLQAKRNSTKTMNRKELSLDSRKFLMLGPLKWETDLYIFTRALFNERLRRHNITPHEVQMT